jgi:hypothetical protein
MTLKRNQSEKKSDLWTLEKLTISKLQLRKKLGKDSDQQGVQMAKFWTKSISSLQ